MGLSDLHLVDQLCDYMNGGPKSLVAMETSSTVSQLVMVSIPLFIEQLKFNVQDGVNGVCFIPRKGIR